MAAIESIGFALGVQPAYLCLVSVARSIPLRVAHPPPQFCPTESVGLSGSALDSTGDVCPDAPINFRTRGQLHRRKDIRLCRKHISTKRCTW
jgi:hypothetical protein